MKKYIYEVRIEIGENYFSVGTFSTQEIALEFMTENYKNIVDKYGLKDTHIMAIYGIELDRRYIREEGKSSFDKRLELSYPLKYRGYISEMKFNKKENVFYGRVVNTKDVITFKSKNKNDAEREFKVAINFYLETCKKNNMKLEAPIKMELQDENGKVFE